MSAASAGERDFRGRYPYLVSVRLTRRQQEELDRLSQEFHVSRARLLRDAIEAGFEPMVRRLRAERSGTAGGRAAGSGTRSKGVADGSGRSVR